MDHIPDVHGIRLDVKLAYTGHDIQYDGLGWETFPARAGFGWLANESITSQDFGQCSMAYSDTELQSLLQAWLYFGLLQECLDGLYELEDFLRPAGHDQPDVVTIRCLAEWKYWNMTAPLSLAQRNSIAIATRMSNLLDNYAHGKGDSWAIFVLSLKLLIEALSSISRYVLARSRDNFLISGYRAQRMDFFMDYDSLSDHAWSEYPLVDSKMASAELIKKHILHHSKAWCPHQLELVCAKVSYSTLVYYSGIKRYERPGIDHTHCMSNLACVAYNIPVGMEQEANHTFADCHCDNAELPGAARTKILRRGGIPILRVCIYHSGKIELAFVPATPTLRYVAISHLWADGLGNPFENSIPTCQLLRLANAAAQVLQLGARRNRRGPWLEECGTLIRDNATIPSRRSRTIHIWLDAYSIPAQTIRMPDRSIRSPDDQKEDEQLKKMAIGRMGTTYFMAEGVLVIDQELEHTAEGSLLPLIGISAWNGRCWTFQEYSFARFTMFQTKTGPAEFDLNIGLSGQSSAIHGFSCLASDLRRLARPLETATANVHFSAVSDGLNFHIAWNELAMRTTTQWDDMILLLAVLLNFKTAQLQRLDTGSQMKAILRTQDSLPAALLFAPLERLSDSGHSQDICHVQDRWIPRSLQNVAIPDIGSMLVTEHGLLMLAQSINTDRSDSKLVAIQIELINQSPRVYWTMEWNGAIRSCWAELDVESLAHCRQRVSSTTEHVVLLYDRNHPLLGVDLTRTFRGACLLPTDDLDTGYMSNITNEETKNMSVLYVCPILWGFVAELQENINSRPYLKWKYTSSHLWVRSDIASWPVLHKARGTNEHFNITATHMSLLLELPIPQIWTVVQFAGIVKYMVNVASREQDLDPVQWITWVLIPLLGNTVVWALLLSSIGSRYLFMYGGQTEVALESTWWRQLHTILSFLPLKEISWLEKWFILTLKLIVWLIVKAHQLVRGSKREPDSEIMI